MLWNDNRESLRKVLFCRDAVALRVRAADALRGGGGCYPVDLAPYPHVRLRTPAAVARWLDDYSSSAISAAARDAPSVSTGR